MQACRCHIPKESSGGDEFSGRPPAQIAFADFAGAFLFPKQSVVEVFSQKRKKVAFAELKQQKEYYGLSIQAILMRLKNLEIINDATYKGFIIWMTKMGYRTKEPGIYVAQYEPTHVPQ